jgi:catechol 2,3-dioxygenase-like lactoylglutathione lyase family enzyme
VLLNLVHVNINVRDLERSIAFYETLGFRVMRRIGDEEVAGRTVRNRGAVMSLGDDPRAACKIELLEWLDPGTEPRPEPGLQTAGVARVAIRTKRLLDFVEQLRERGVAFLGDPVEIDVMGAKRFVLLRDPDGTLLEFIEF